MGIFSVGYRTGSDHSPIIHIFESRSSMAVNNNYMLETELHHSTSFMPSAFSNQQSTNYSLPAKTKVTLKNPSLINSTSQGEISLSSILVPPHGSPKPSRQIQVK
jgi:hypothetical protein